MNCISQIHNFLYLGSMDSTKKNVLLNNDITYVFHIGFTISESDKLQHVKYNYIDMDDNSFNKDKMIENGLIITQTINNLDLHKEKILICCLMGRSRSASMVVFYLLYNNPKLSYYDAIIFIKKIRSISINQSFADKLQEYFIENG
uniref:Tyrosine specific protein phosphatases domain-containing protein n=1 Tax=viral metagenome TaxID=1070528 RepID=A0A6C0H543_9ZZZZ